MLAHQLHHLEHCDGVLFKHGLEGIVAQNLSLIGRVLQVLVLDVRPTGDEERVGFGGGNNRRKRLRDGELGGTVN